jgi:Flp pilus assembly protein TadG
MRVDSSRGEHGVAAVMVALLLVPLLGAAAIVVDVGQLYQEKRELQNGADAAALAIAYDCAVGSCGDDGATANLFADSNASDGAATAVATTDEEAGTVTVETETDGASGNQVSFFFAQVLDSGLTGQTVTASAKARWATPARLTTIPLIFSSCEWSNAVGTPPTFPTGYRLIFFHAANGANADPPSGSWCSFGPGQDQDGDGDRAEGGFGFLAGDGCAVTIDAGGWVPEKPGTGTPSLDCSLEELVGLDILIPIFDDVSDDRSLCDAGSQRKCYHVMGFAALHVVDLGFNGGVGDARAVCGNANRRCIGGHFTTFVTLEDGLDPDPGDSEFGVAYVELVE